MTTENRSRSTRARVDGSQGRIERAMCGGASLDQVDAQIIRPLGLDDDHEAALWLYARSLTEPGRRRYKARQALVARRAREGATAAGTD